jgi:signal transduction histidine kinase/DNA-binding response OmpR family regulator
MNVQPSPAKTSAKRTRKVLGPRARILLVDDDERNLLALTEVLQPISEVVTATSGREALRHLLKGDFAVILLDVFMPGMDGYETASLVRAREQTSRIPIIFLSAVNKETEHLMRGYAMGAVDYVFKPVDPLILKSKVGVFVDLYEVRRQVEEKAASEQKLLDEMLTAQKALRAAEETHSLMIGSLPIILFARDCSGELTPPRIIGGDLERVTGYSEPPSLDAWQERVHLDDRARLAEEYRKLPDAGALAIEYRWRRADGAYRHFLEQTMVYVDRTTGRPEIVGTILDVTSQKTLEAQLVQAGKMDAIGQLTGGVAHDFNNLLSAVLGGLHVLERRLTLAERDQLIIDQMRHAAEQGAELVRRMMAFARKQDLRPVSVDPAALCTSVAGLVEHTLGGTVGIDWACSETEGNLYVDKSQLELALVNLIINARDSMPQGGRIDVRIDDADPSSAPSDLGLRDRHYIRIRVQDEGEGIPSELVDRITEPFFTTKAAGEGTGLGLSMVLGFVQQSEGKMRIQSAPGQGTTIDLYLPSTPQPTPEDAAKADQAAPISTSKAVLLVDDDDAVRTVLGEQLREMGFQVDAVADGGSAIERLRSTTAYDVLLTDFAMPGINGLDTIRSAMIERPGMRYLLMTGYADEDAVAAARDTVAVIRKPINMDDLMRRIG